MSFHIMALALATTALPGGVVAAPVEPLGPTCPGTPVLPADLQGWNETEAGATVRGYQASDVATVVPLGERRTALSLHKGDELAYRVAPARAASAAKWGGMVPIAVEKAGRLVVAVDAAAWIDLVQDDAIIASAGHGHGPACSGIRKMVEFDVTPGRYLLQIVDAPQPSIHAMAILREEAGQGEGSGGR